MSAIKLVVAVSHGDVMGMKGKLPWPSFSKDMQHFRELTQGHVVIMGRKTWESLPEAVRPLPGRVNMVLTRKADFQAEGAEIYYDIPTAIQEAEHRYPDKDIFVIGGAELYKQTSHLADTLIITNIDKTYEGDTFFPITLKYWELYRQEDVVDKGVILSFRWYQRYLD